MTPDVLVLARNSLADTPVWQWLDPDTPLRIITQPSAVDTAVPERVEVVRVAGYDHSEAVEVAALDAYRTRPYTRLEIISEWDVLRAARLRERLGLRGQGYASANAFRDKALMKDIWSAAGLLTAAYTRVELPTDLLAFADYAGTPIVVKPRRAAGSLGVRVLRSPADVAAWLATSWRVPSGGYSPWMAEAFVEGQLMQVDGYFNGGTLEIAWPSTLDSLLGWQQDTGIPALTVMLDPHDPAVGEVQSIVSRALTALPTPRRTAFHAELWRTADGSLVLNEIAARVGGARTTEMIQAAFGVNLRRRALRAALYPDRIAEERPGHHPRRCAGFAMVPRRSGHVARVDHLPRELKTQPWLVEACIRLEPGEQSRAANNSVDAAAHFVATGANHAQVTERLREATAWSERAIRYETGQARVSA